MAGFEAIYKQTVTLFNRVPISKEHVMWYATVIEGVHLIIDHSSSWDSQGGNKADNASLHVRYLLSDGDVLVAGKKFYEPKAWRRLARPEEGITFGYGNNEDFDFFVEGEYTEFASPIADDLFDRRGFYNYMNKNYDNVFAIKSVSKYNLIPHFEISAG